MTESAEDIDDFVIKVGKLAAWLFIPLMLVITYDVTQRKILDYYPDYLDTVFSFSSTKLQELEWHLHATLFLFCLGFGYARDAHVRIELVRDHLKPKSRVWLEIIGAMLFLLPYCYLVVKFGYTFAERAWTSNEVSAAQTGLSHRWIIKAILPAGFAFLALSGIAGLLKNIVYLFGPDDLKPRVAEYAGTHHADQPDDLAEHGPITD
ncbi:MAG: C4-dicarboxylate ABC transporter permease [Hyphomicrobiales bacterium]|nr:MAG: C4-dicarboxylate ABC transporter permease [Hyphomicrobiales bacterium]